MSTPANFHPSPSTATLTENNLLSPPQQAQPTLPSSASNASFNTSTTASATPTQRPFANAAFRRNLTEGPLEPQKSLFGSFGPHPSSTDPLFLHGAWFKDRTGRTVTLRGVNLSGASKMPTGCPSHQAEGFLEKEGREVSFVGRPFPLEEADQHLSRLRHWGFNLLRFIVTWEAIEHAGPGQYDYEYFEYLIQVFKKCKEHGFKCFLDPHQDVWSRFSGGSGAPLWTLYLAGLDPATFPKTGAALVHNLYHDPENYPKMVWATNYNKLAAATMFTLFFAGSTFAPDCVVDEMNIQDYLQTHYIKSYMALAEYITAQDGIEDDVVIGYDTLNEPSAGWIGVEDITKFPHHQELKKDATPTPLQAMMLGQGIPQTVEFWVTTFFGPKRKGSTTIDPEGATAWLTAEKREEMDRIFGWDRSPDYPRAGDCIWAAHGVWDVATQKALDPEYFIKDPSTGEAFSFDARSFLPFCRRFAQAVRTVHKAAIIFLEPPVNEIPPSLPPPHDDDDVAQFDINSRVVYAPHWYDGLTLLNKKWNFFNIDYLGVKRGRYPNYAAAVKIGEKAIKECFRNQLACIKEEGQIAIGQHPTLIGEIGIPYDMNDGKSYKANGNYKDQIKAMEANMYALESNHLNFTLWNYCPDNSHKWGDQWNGEDLSLWSRDDLARDPRRITRKSGLSAGVATAAAAAEGGFSLHHVGSSNSVATTANEDSNNISIDVRDSPPDTPAIGLTRRSSSSVSVGGAKPSPVHARVATLSNSTSSSASTTSSSSSQRPLLGHSDSNEGTSGSKGHGLVSALAPSAKNMEPTYLDLGGRALIAFCRPFAQKVDGIPLDLSFNLNTVTFKFSFKRVPSNDDDDGFNPFKSSSDQDKKKGAPTEIYLPRIHFPCAQEYLDSLALVNSTRKKSSSSSPSNSGSSTLTSSSASAMARKTKDATCSVTVSGGHWKWKEGEQILYWWTDPQDQEDDNDHDDDSEENDSKFSAADSKSHRRHRRRNGGTKTKGSRFGSDQDEDVFEITIVGKKWAGNSITTPRLGGGLWNTVSQCCRLS